MTATFGVVGHPVAHSRSPAMHRAWIDAAGLDAVYVTFDVGPQPDGARVVDALRTLGVAGANLTVPLKESVLPHLDAVAPQAAAIGAVNTVVLQGGRLVGSNTDADGFCDGVEARGRPIRGSRALVLGAGGAGRAVAAGLAERGAYVHLLNRTEDRAHRAAEHLAAHGLVVQAGGLGLADVLSRTADLLVCAVSGPGADAVRRLDVSGFRQDALWVDLNYWCPDPPLGAELRARGVDVCDGRAMLVHQGARAFRAFTGRHADPALGWRALRSGDAS